MLGTRRTGTLDVSRYPRMFPVARSVMPGSRATLSNRKICIVYLPPLRHWYALAMADTQFRSAPALRWRETLTRIHATLSKVQDNMLRPRLPIAPEHYRAALLA